MLYYHNKRERHEEGGGNRKKGVDLSYGRKHEGGG